MSIVKREVRFLAPTELSMLSNVELVEFRSVGDASEEGWFSFILKSYIIY